jgi:hypothetical protein
MRSLGCGLVLLGTVAGHALGCGQSERDPAAAGGSAGVATAGGSSSAGTPAGQAGADATAGIASGGSSVAGSASGGAATAGGQPSEAGAGNDAGGATSLVDCDPKKILCKRLAPPCDAGEVPSIDGSCYGECVKIDRCACSAAAQCPQPEQYTCWAQEHCGPFVE